MGNIATHTNKRSTDPSITISMGSKGSKSKNKDQDQSKKSALPIRPSATASATVTSSSTCNSNPVNNATAPLKKACEIYGLKWDDVAYSDPPVPFLSKKGNDWNTSMCVVKLSDMAALKKRVVAKEKEDEERIQQSEKLKTEKETQAFVQKYGRAHYDELGAEIAQKRAAFEAHLNHSQTMKRLLEEMKRVVAAGASHGMHPRSLEEVTISKTSAKKDWYLTDKDLDKITTPYNNHASTKKTKQYPITTVIVVLARLCTMICSTMTVKFDALAIK